jgi:hypothetical protein
VRTASAWHFPAVSSATLSISRTTGVRSCSRNIGKGFFGCLLVRNGGTIVRTGKMTRSRNNIPIPFETLISYPIF